MASSGSDEDGEGFLPCACCKHQRKTCSPTCETAPYFPLTKYQEYLNAERIFGTANIMRIMNSVQPHHRVAAADTLMAEAEARARRNAPARGCCNIIRHLRFQIAIYQAQLYHVNQQLAFYKAQEMKQLQKRRDLEKLQLFAGLSTSHTPDCPVMKNNIARPSHSETGSTTTANNFGNLTPTSTRKQIIDLESLEFEDETADQATSGEALGLKTIDLLTGAFSKHGNNAAESSLVERGSSSGTKDKGKKVME